MSTQFSKEKESDVPRWRCFIALALDEAQRDRLQHIQGAMRQGLPENARRALRLTQAHAFHLTLRFLGDVAAADTDALQEAVHRSCRNTVPFALRLIEPGCFPDSRNPRVVWAGVGGELEALRKLQSRVVQETAAFGEPPETRAYQPHLTLARVNTRDRHAARVIGQSVERLSIDWHDDLQNIWSVHEVHLIRSELLPGGSRYTTLGSFPFRAASS
jgi:2'-5' RNA ligase